MLKNIHIISLKSQCSLIKLFNMNKMSIKNNIYLPHATYKKKSTEKISKKNLLLSKNWWVGWWIYLEFYFI